MQDKDFDKVLEELNLKLFDIQNQIAEVKKSKEDFKKAGSLRKDFLLRNSIPLAEVVLEVYDDNFFVIGTDNSFTYAMRLTKEQAEHIADSFDSELGKYHIDKLLSKEIVGNSINPILRNINIK
jgi:hypothetical protein